jgi:hypothetical protein
VWKFSEILSIPYQDMYFNDLENVIKYREVFLLRLASILEQNFINEYQIELIVQLIPNPCVNFFNELELSFEN